VYVTNVHDDSISEYAIGSGGALTLIGTVGAGGTTPAAITLDATGQFAYATLRDSNSVAEFSVGSDGTLTLLGTIATGSGTAPSGIATIH
jgi:6-phosphogluconolactonase (cycloisomerase 2 family)